MPSPVQAERTLQRSNLRQQPCDVAVYPHALVIARGAAVLRRFAEQRLLPIVPVGPDARERLAPVVGGAVQQALEAPPRGRRREGRSPLGQRLGYGSVNKKREEDR